MKSGHDTTSCGSGSGINLGNDSVGSVGLLCEISESGGIGSDIGSGSGIDSGVIDSDSGSLHGISNIVQSGFGNDCGSLPGTAESVAITSGIGNGSGANLGSGSNGIRSEDSTTLAEESPPPAFIITYGTTHGNLANLTKKFPQYTPKAIMGLCDSLDHNYFATDECLSSGVSVEQVLYYLHRKYIKIAVAEGPQIYLESDNVHDWVDAAFGFYKGNRFQKDAPVRLVLKGKSVVDAGGVGQQFYYSII